MVDGKHEMSKTKATDKTVFYYLELYYSTVNEYSLSSLIF